MPISRIVIKNYKSIKHCDLMLKDLNLLIGENGAGKSNIIEALQYFYDNLISSKERSDIFDENNVFSNEINIDIYYDIHEFVIKAKANTTNAFLPDVKFNGYFSKIIKLGIDKHICLSMNQIKGHSIKWNKKYEDRFVLKSLFPFFYINSRDLNLFDWDYLWEIIGDIIKVSNDERKILQKSITEILNDTKYDVSKKIKHIDNMLFMSKYEISKDTSKDFAKLLAKVYFQGSAIKLRGKELSFFSTGTNSVNYIELILKTLCQLSKDKLKKPLFLIDEPEINLHHSYIDSLSYVFIESSDNIQMLITTHSPRLTKNIIKSKDNCSVFRVTLNEYTFVYEMKLFSHDPKTIYRVTDDHANAYFSKAILFVEGESELELFSNPYLRLLFIELKKIDIFKSISDDVIKDIMLPEKVKTKIPYLILLDLDKIISYQLDKSLFRPTQYLKNKNNKEIYLFRSKKTGYQNTLYSQRQRITAMTDKCKFYYDLPFYSCTDPKFINYISLIKHYFLKYNIFVCNTTIEGVLINKDNISIALSYLQTKKDPTYYNTFYSFFPNLNTGDQCNVLRLIFNGKSDLLFNLKNFTKMAKDKDTKALFEMLYNMKIGDKTDGWITEFLDFYFKQTFPDGIKQMRKEIEDDTKKRKVIINFSSSFPEFFDLECNIFKLLSKF